MIVTSGEDVELLEQAGVKGSVRLEDDHDADALLKVYVRCQAQSFDTT